MKKVILFVSSMFVLSGCSLGFNHVEKEQNVTQLESSTSKGNEKTTSDLTPEAIEENSTAQPSAPKLTLEAVFFNEIAQVDGEKIIQNPENKLTLVNKVFALPEDYIPGDLVRPDVEFSFGNQDIEKSYMRQEAASALEKMFADAKSQDIHLFAVSGYRSYQRQDDNFHNKVNKIGAEAAAKIVAYPGNSEHQTGLAIDISSQSANFKLTEQFGGTPEGKWLMENAHRFGYILRYPKGLETITGYNYEPWHYRYVGLKAAAEIYKNQLTLEEYFNIVEKI
ncbi:MAG: D-alanyl-D-alanine carboxypeptidase family protein [Bacillus sp. (in: firmicutes)]